jgi:hypothetical protein
MLTIASSQDTLPFILSIITLFVTESFYYAMVPLES